MAGHQDKSITRWLPGGVSLLINGAFCVALLRLLLPQTEKESRIAVELQPVVAKKQTVSTALPPPPPRIVKITRQAKKLLVEKEKIEQQKPKTFNDVVTQLLDKHPEEPKHEEKRQDTVKTPETTPTPASPVTNEQPKASETVPTPVQIAQQPDSVQPLGNHGDDAGPGHIIGDLPAGHNDAPGAGNGDGNGIGKGNDAPGDGHGAETNGAGAGPGASTGGGDHPGNGNRPGDGDGGAEKSPKAAGQENGGATGGGGGTEQHGPSRGCSVRSKKQPDYPQDARDEGVEGTVRLLVTVNANGKVVGTPKVKKSSGNRSLDKAAVRGVKDWSFEPALEDGKPVESTMVVDVRFSLND